MTQLSRGNRRGACFTTRISDDDRSALEALRAVAGGPRALGPWLVWRALAGESPSRVLEAVPGPGTNRAGVPADVGAVPVQERVILDLCSGSGSWSEPYVKAGYPVLRATLPEIDVRVFPYVEPGTVWGVLAAPPCNEFSRAKRRPRDYVRGLEVVSACLRVILLARPRWWALENPGGGDLAEWLGPPRDNWQPHEFGDPWTKLTALWGDFALPRRGPFVAPTGSAMDRPTAALRAVTPPGFARAFFEANP